VTPLLAAAAAAAAAGDELMETGACREMHGQRGHGIPAV